MTDASFDFPAESVSTAPKVPSDGKKGSGYVLVNGDWGLLASGFVTFDTNTNTIVLTSTEGSQPVIVSVLYQWEQIICLDSPLLNWRDEQENCNPTEYAIVFDFASDHFEFVRAIAVSFDVILDHESFFIPKDSHSFYSLQHLEAEIEPYPLPPCSLDVLAELVSFSDADPAIPSISLSLTLDSGSYMYHLFKLVCNLIPASDDVSTNLELMSENSQILVGYACLLIKNLLKSLRNDLYDLIFGEKIFPLMLVILSHDPSINPNHRRNFQLSVPTTSNPLELPISLELQNLFQKLILMEYVRDTVLSIYFDDLILGTISTVIMMNQRNFVAQLCSCPEFFTKLFEFFGHSDINVVTTAVQTALTCLNFAKNLISFKECGLLIEVFHVNNICSHLNFVFHLFLNKDQRTEQSIKTCLIAVEVVRILSNLAVSQLRRASISIKSQSDSDPKSIILNQSFLNVLLKVVVSPDCNLIGCRGVASQVLEILGTILDVQSYPSESSLQNEFLTFFYDQSIPILVSSLNNITIDSKEINEINAFIRTTEIFSLILHGHPSYQVKVAFFHQKILVLTSVLLQSTNIKAKLSYLRLLRSFLSLGDEFVVNHIIRHDLFNEIVLMFLDRFMTDDVITSTILSIFAVLLPPNEEIIDVGFLETSPTATLFKNYRPLITNISTKFPQLKEISTKIPLVGQVFFHGTNT
ncbi:hypothetical protein RCL1_006470 [Eukaryota sp. TZLM3-RCL]